MPVCVSCNENDYRKRCIDMRTNGQQDRQMRNTQTYNYKLNVIKQQYSTVALIALKYVDRRNRIKQLSK